MGDRAVVGTSDATASLDRSAQTLPVPLGGLVPVHRRATALRRVWDRYRAAPALAAALASAIGGIWLSTSTRTFYTGRDASGIHIDDMTLAPATSSVVGTQVFTGAATVAIAVTPSMERAGAVMTWNGLLTTGRCVLARRPTGAVETCAYAIGATRLTSNDTYIAATRTWSRRYGDGVEIAIHVPHGSALIPIPFPLGR